MSMGRHEGIGVPLSRGRGKSSLSICKHSPRKALGEHKQEAALTRAWPCWPPSQTRASRTVRNKGLFVEPPGLWSSAVAACTA